jgi:uncharacterized damage-inducible protein DinB
MQKLRLALREGPGRSFADISAALLREYADKIRIGIERLTEDQIWWRPNARSNSIGNLILHLCGNLSMWVIDAIGGERARRDRPAEFSADRTRTRAELLAQLEQTVEKCRAALARPIDLGRAQTIQGYPVDALGAIYHAVEHASYHTGQILWIVKQFSPELELYPGH